MRPLGHSPSSADFTGRDSARCARAVAVGHHRHGNGDHELRCVEFFHIKSGKATEHRCYFDSGTMMRQLGLAS